MQWFQVYSSKLFYTWLGFPLDFLKSINSIDKLNKRKWRNQNHFQKYTVMI